MNSTTRNLVIAGALAAGVLGGTTIASAQTGTTVPSTSAPTAPTDGTVPDAADPAKPAMCDGQGRGGHGPGGEDMSARDTKLAEKLGVSVDQVTAAHEAARTAVDEALGATEKPAAPPTTSPTDEERAAREADRTARQELMEKTFAEKLGVST